jgi:hypothetical protein
MNDDPPALSEHELARYLAFAQKAPDAWTADEMLEAYALLKRLTPGDRVIIGRALRGAGHEG